MEEEDFVLEVVTEDLGLNVINLAEMGEGVVLLYEPSVDTEEDLEQCSLQDKNQTVPRLMVQPETEWLLPRLNKQEKPERPCLNSKQKFKSLPRSNEQPESERLLPRLNEHPEPERGLNTQPESQNLIPRSNAPSENPQPKPQPRQNVAQPALESVISRLKAKLESDHLLSRVDYLHAKIESFFSSLNSLSEPESLLPRLNTKLEPERLPRFNPPPEPKSLLSRLNAQLEPQRLLPRLNSLPKPGPARIDVSSRNRKSFVRTPSDVGDRLSSCDNLQTDGRSFTGNDPLEAEGIIFPCVRCDQTFTNSETSIAHLKQHLATTVQGSSLSYKDNLTKNVPGGSLSSNLLPDRSSFTENVPVGSQSDNLPPDQSNLTENDPSEAQSIVYPCVYCNETFANSENSIAHLRQHIMAYKCGECDRSFKNIRDLTIHVKKHGKRRIFRCTYCGISLNDRRSLAAHKRQHQQNIPFQCASCERSFEDVGDLTCHVLEHIEPPSYAGSRNLSGHEREHTEELNNPSPALEVPLNNSTGKSPEHIGLSERELLHPSPQQEQQQYEERTSNKYIMCCDQSYTDSGNLSVHEPEHTEELNNQSPALEAPLNNSTSELPEHVGLSEHELQHPSPQQEQQQCEEETSYIYIICCDESYTDSGNLSVHEREHTEELNNPSPALEVPLNNSTSELPEHVGLSEHELQHPSPQQEQQCEEGTSYVYIICCDESYTDSGNLSVHEREHTEELNNPNPALEAPLNSTSESPEHVGLSEHESQHPSPQQEQQQCEEETSYVYILWCDQSYTDSGNLSLHEREHTEELNNPSPFLETSLNNSASESPEHVGLSEHELQHPSPQQEQQQCEEETSYVYIICCDESYTDSGNPVHEREHTEELNNPGPVLEAPLNNSTSELPEHVGLSERELQHPSPQQEQQQCEEETPYVYIICCEESYTDSGNLSLHEREHPEELNNQSPSLEAPLCNLGELPEHPLTCPETDTPGQQDKCQEGASCLFCYRSFSSIELLTKHVVSHLRMTTYLCEFCGQTFTNETDLALHQRIHATDRMCPHCLHRCEDDNDLALHQLLHKPTVQVLYQCTICDKKFTSVGHLTVHRRRHLDPNRRSTCPFCDQWFSEKSLLIAHMRSHSGSSPYRCHYCSLSFSSRDHLAAHIGRKHSGL